MNDRIAVEKIHGGHEAILELLPGGDANVPQDGTGEFRKEALDEIEPRAVIGVKVNSKRCTGWTTGLLSEMSKEELVDALRMSWTHALPKKRNRRPQ